MADTNAKAILVAGPPFRGYLRMIADGFKACGVQPSLLEWKYPKRNFAQEIMFYSSNSFRTEFEKNQDEANAAALEKAVTGSEPDYVLVMKAVDLTEKTKEHCADTGTKLVLWAYDSATEFPIIERSVPDYDLVYTYEPADMQTLSHCCSPKFLPMAYDQRYYFKHADAEKKDIDICFIGAIDPYPQRRRLLRQISRAFREKRISVWADSIHWYSHRHVRDMALFGARRNVDLHRQTLGHDAVSDVYNRSKICLNIHHKQSVKAVNPRTFEVLGSGGLLVTDRRLDDIEGFEEGEGYIYYSNEAELILKLRDALENEQKATCIADMGHSRALAHTFEQRARRILGDLG